MEIDTESDTDPLSDNPNTSDEEFLDDSDVDTRSSSSSDSAEETRGVEEQGQPIVQGAAENASEESTDSEGPIRRTLSNVAPLPSSDDDSAPRETEVLVVGEPHIDMETSTDEPICIKKSDELVPPKTPTKGNESMGSDDDSMMCPICFEHWTTSGSHRLVSLKCGHLFGSACIEKWIKQPKAKCPQCNHLARRTDIRKIYARSLKVLDTSERDRAVKDLEKEQEKRRHAEVEAAGMRLKYNMVSQECERYKKELMEHKHTIEHLRSSNKKMGSRNKLESSGSMQSYGSKAFSKPSFVLEKTLDLCKDGGCRVMAVSNLLPLLVVSQPSNSTLFPSFGFKKISTMDFRQTEYVPVHQKALKDLAFHSHDSLVLSAALDKTVKITNVYSNSVVQSYNLEADAWSCTWSKDDPCSFFAGLRTGKVLQFDTRVTSKHVCQLPSTRKGHPVVNMQYLQKSPAAPLGMSGPVSLQLSACTFFEQKDDKDFRIHPMPIEGTFTSLCMEPTTGHMLVSCRPSVHHLKVTHLLCELTYKNISQDPSLIDTSCSCNIVQSLEGGPFQAQLTRSRLFLHPANHSSVIACSGDESSKAVMIWDASNKQCLSQLPADSPVLDLCSFRSDTAFCLGTLTEKQLRVYKWNDV